MELATYTSRPKVVQSFNLPPDMFRKVISMLTVEDLKRMCEELKIKKGGRKSEIVKRIWLSVDSDVELALILPYDAWRGSDSQTRKEKDVSRKSFVR